MKANFTAAVHFVLMQECVFAKGHDGDLNFVVTEDVPGDDGGVTKFGIDQTDHPHINVRELTLDQAIQIYHDEEWTKCRCDDLPNYLDAAVFDCAVNQGMATAIKLLQRAVNDATGTRLTVDGQIGPATIAAAIRFPAAELKQFLLKRVQLYNAIAAAHPGDKKFLHGWDDRITDLAKYCGTEPPRFT